MKPEKKAKIRSAATDSAIVFFGAFIAISLGYKSGIMLYGYGKHEPLPWVEMLNVLPPTLLLSVGIGLVFFVVGLFSKS